jgi:6,7-dimethyl-8-ribityllumazine synthase
MILSVVTHRNPKASCVLFVTVMSTHNIKGLSASDERFDGSPLRIAIVHARWNTVVIDALLDGTIDALKKSGVKESNIVVQSVPGSFELPFGVSR